MGGASAFGAGKPRKLTQAPGPHRQAVHPGRRSVRRSRDSHPPLRRRWRAGRRLQVDRALPARAVGVRDEQADGPAAAVLFQALAAAAKLPPIRLHDLRHGAASLMLAAGVPAKVVQETLGHSTITLTLARTRASTARSPPRRPRPRRPSFRARALLHTYRIHTRRRAPRKNRETPG